MDGKICPGCKFITQAYFKELKTTYSLFKELIYHVLKLYT